MEKKPLQLILKMSKYTLYGFVFQMLLLNVVLAHRIEAQKMDQVYVSVSFDGERLIKVFREVEAQSDFYFTIHENKSYLRQKVTVHHPHISVEDLLKDIGRQTGLSFQQVNHNISIRQKAQPRVEKTDQLEVLEEVTVTGTVSDQSGAPMPGVTVSVSGTTIGTATDLDGRYSLSVPEGSTLVFSFIGFETQSIPVGDRSVIDVVLNEDMASLDEVVVVGYGTQSKRLVTGSISKVDLERNEELPNTNLLQSLRGSVAGVQVLDNGRPGQGGSVLIRGRRSITANNNPLIILDGVFFNGNLSDINPSDIESMEILKDASSTAIYGSRAANGVIIITSKKGVSDKPLIRLNSYYGVQGWSNKVKLLTPDRYIQKTLDYRRQSNQEANPSNIEDYLEPLEAINYRNGVTLDPWEVISQQAALQNYDLSVSGRTKNTAYYLSAALTDEKGLIFNDVANRISVRSNVETNVTSWFKIGVNSMFSKSDQSGLEASTTSGYQLSPFAQLFEDNDEEKPIVYPANDLLVRNPLFDAMIQQDEDVTSNLFASFFATVDFPFLEGLSFRVNYSPNYRWNHRYRFTPVFQEQDLNLQGEGSKINAKSFDWVLENIVDYEKQLGQSHRINLTLLYGRNQFSSESTTARASNFFNDVLSWNNLSLGQIQEVASEAAVQDGISSMARFNYGYKDRYLITVTARRDGTSVFGQENKFGLFPSAAFAWIVSEENFMRNAGPLEFLKIRISHGETGNQAIGPYQSLSRAETTQYVFGDGGATSIGLFPSAMANSQLSWETTVTSNLGVDFSLLNNRISGSAEVYNMSTKDLLLFRSIPSMNGFTGVHSNIGETRNTGFEFSLNTLNIDKGNFSWTSSLAISHNKNEIVNLYGMDKDEDGVEDDDIGNKWFIGHPIQVEYDYVFDGIYQVGDELPAGYNPGYVRLKDLNGDGQITPSDRQVLGQREPNFRYGLTNQFHYNNFSLSFLMTALTGWMSKLTILDMSSFSSNFPGRAANMIDAGWWTEENQSETRPSLVYTNPLAHHFYESRDFLRIQDVTFSYSLPSPVVQRIGINGLKFYVSGRNIYTLTNWSGFDPESGYDNRAAFPTPRTIVGGFNLTF